MHLPVWIITGVTDPMELGRAFREAEQLAEPFRESNINPGTDPDNETLARSDGTGSAPGAGTTPRSPWGTR